jgi:hypothetical protein
MFLHNINNILHLDRFQMLSDMAHKLRIHSIIMTDLSASGYNIHL